MSELWMDMIGGIVIAAIAGYAMWLWFRLRGAPKAPPVVPDAENLYDRMRNVEAQLSALMTTAVPLSELVLDGVIQELTHAHAPELDGLLARIKGDDLSPDEEKRLFDLLKERTEMPDHRINRDERDAAIMLPPVMRRVKQERENPPAETELRVVSVPVIEGK